MRGSGIRARDKCERKPTLPKTESSRNVWSDIRGFLGIKMVSVSYGGVGRLENGTFGDLSELFKFG